MRGRRAAAAALGLVAVALMTGSSMAAEVPVAYRSPAPDEVVKTATVTVSVDVPVGVTAGLQKFRLELAGEKERATQESEAEPGEPCPTLTFSVPVRHNGRYSATITALSADPTASCEGAGTAPRAFFVAAPPARPGGVKAVLANGQVKVSWDSNPEPDIVSYRIQRATGPTAAFEPAGETPATSFTDLSVGQGGGFRYRVVAVRKGARPQETVSSEPSPPVSATAAGLSRGRTGPLASPPPLNLPGAGAGAGGGAAGAPGTADSGFDANLPYGEVPEDGAEELGAERARTRGVRSLGSVAGGLLALATFLLLRCLRKEADRLPLPN